MSVTVYGICFDYCQCINREMNRNENILNDNKMDVTHTILASIVTVFKNGELEIVFPAFLSDSKFGS